METIGLIPGSFKPMHWGHWWVIRVASLFVDELWLFVSLHERGNKNFQITSFKAEGLWKKFYLPIMPKNTAVWLVDQPVRGVIETLRRENEDVESSDRFIVISDEQDLNSNFLIDRVKKKYVPKLLEQNRLFFVPAPRLFSATKMREFLEFKEEHMFIKNLPRKLRKRGKEIYLYLKS